MNQFPQGRDEEYINSKNLQQLTFDGNNSIIHRMFHHFLQFTNQEHKENFRISKKKFDEWKKIVKNLNVSESFFRNIYKKLYKFPELHSRVSKGEIWEMKDIRSWKDDMSEPVSLDTEHIPTTREKSMSEPVSMDTEDTLTTREKSMLEPVSLDTKTQSSLCEDYILSPEQEKTIQYFREEKSFCILGEAGSGKSFMIRKMYDMIPDKNTIQVTALTGCAAVGLGIKNTKTLHSFLGGISNDKSKLVSNIEKNEDIYNRWLSLQYLIVDEVSMLDVKLFEVLNDVAQEIRGNKKLMGGIITIFSGDFYQLPPVEGTFCFNCPLWNKLFPWECHIQYKKIFRQKDDELFQDILKQIRNGKVDDKYLKLLEQKEKEPNGNGVKLFAKRQNVEMENIVEYEKLQTKEYVFELIKDNIDCYEESFLDEVNKVLIKDSRWDIKVKLKVGCKVMLTYNLDIPNGICNGSQGEIIAFENGHPVVKFTNGIKRTIKRQEIKSEDYPDICISQIPLILSYAITIHKAQGVTLEKATIDMDNIFKDGQAYVAISRVKTWNGLSINKFKKSSIRSDKTVKKFYEDIEKNGENV